MVESLVKGRTLPEAYHAALKELDEYGEISPCPDYNTNQKELSMTMEATVSWSSTGRKCWMAFWISR